MLRLRHGSAVGGNELGRVALAPAKNRQNPVLHELRIPHDSTCSLRGGVLSLAGLVLVHTTISLVGLLLSNP